MSEQESKESPLSLCCGVELAQYTETTMYGEVVTVERYCPNCMTFEPDLAESR